MLQSYKVFQTRGAELLSPDFFTAQAGKIRTIVFDWDGVFHDGKKDKSGNSSFSEIDSMGINMLRFGYFLLHGEIPRTFIITGEENHTGFDLATREHFDAVYFKIKNKTDVLDHMKNDYGTDPASTLFVFDDILDISLASKAGLRIMVRNDATPLFKAFAKTNNRYDYYTANNASNHAIRECSEILLEAIEKFEETVKKRICYDACYSTYINNRNSIKTSFFTMDARNDIFKGV